MSSSSLKGKHNFQCASEASLDLIKLPLKDILLSQIRPEDLFLKIQNSSLLHGRNPLRTDQRKLCYFPPPVLPDYNKFDATLLYTLIRNLCPGLMPTRGWGNEPGQYDIQVGDDIERLRLFRNNNFAHLSSAIIPDDTFEDVWKTLKSVLIRLKSHSGCSVDYVNKFGEIEYSQFRYELWEQYKDIWKAYLEIKKQTDERAIRIKGNEEVICGNSAIFNAEVEHAENFCLPIIWQRRRGKWVEIIDQTLEKYSGSTNTRLVMSSVCKMDAMEYQAFLPDGYNQMLYSNTINLHVLGEKPFLNDLEVTTEDEGIKIHYSFGVLENSPQVQDITWSKNGHPMYIGYDKFIRGSVHDSCLIIKSPSEDDKGKYSCTVTNAVGSKEKKIVLDVPCIAILTKPTVHFASDTTITSIVTSKPQPEKAQWQNSKNGNDFYEIDVTDSKYFGSNVSPECPRLVIPKTTFDDMLYYRLQITNKIGVNVSNAVYLKVTGSLPNITVNHETDINNKSIKLTGVVFLSDDSPGIREVYWSKNGKLIDIQESGGRLSGVTIDDPSLTIRNVSVKDVGKYQLTAINAIGKNNSDVITIDFPSIKIFPKKNWTGGNDCMCFMMNIKSIPSPCHAQWYVKPKEGVTFTILDVNAKDYQGSTNSLPHPKLVVKQRDQLEKNVYQIKITNFVGSTDKEISGDQSRPMQKPEEWPRKRHETDDPRGPKPKKTKNQEYNWYSQRDASANIGFAKLNNYLGIHFPHDKFQNLKKILLDTKQVEKVEGLNAANNAGECFSILQEENLFTRNDVILMQFLCKETQCTHLYKECINYAMTHKALCFTENPPDNGYKKVQIHIHDDCRTLSGKQIQEIVKIVAAMLECKEEDILVVDVSPSGSVILVLFVKEEFAWKFTALKEDDSQKLRRLKVDYIIVDEKTILLEASTEIFERKPFHITDRSCTQYRVHQCSKCPGEKEYYCETCPCDLCHQCKENHEKDLKTIDHDVVSHRDQINYIPSPEEICVRHPSNVYITYCEPCGLSICFHCRKHRNHRQLQIITAFKTKRQQHKRTIQTIKSETLFYRPLLMPRIKADFDTCHTEFSRFKSEMLTKANNLKTQIDKVENMFCDFDYKHSCLNQKLEINRHIVSIQRYVHRYEQSAFSALQFLSSIKKALPQRHLTLHTSQLSMTESLNKKNVIESLSAIRITERGNRCIRNEYLLKRMPCAVVHQSLAVTGVGCAHISCVTSDRVWVSDNYENLILTDTTGVPLHHLDDIYSCFTKTGGVHTVNNKSELIYIDRNYNIYKLSRDMKTTTKFLATIDYSWKPWCVYWSPSTGDLLVGMYNYDTETGKVTRYNLSGQLTQTIQCDNTELDLFKEPRYITENNNGDVVVSDNDAVVVTERGGRHRFSYTGHPLGLWLWPNGVCTDALSHILVCEDFTKSVQILDKDGQFLSHLLIRPSGIFVPSSLCYDVNTHRLWVGSWHNNTVVIYRFITRQDALTAAATADVMESLSEISTKVTEKPQQEEQCLLKLMLLQFFTVTGVDDCAHISCVTSDRVWVSDNNGNLILTNTTGVPLCHVNDFCSTSEGVHTVNNESELIYIDRNYNINKLSKDMKTTTTFLETTDSLWKPWCVYWSPSTGDLLVGMYNYVTDTGKVTRYNQSGKLTDTIQCDNSGLKLYEEPRYITENNNGDVVVLDDGAVIVTERGGRYRFSYTGHALGSSFWPHGICTDALSHILVSDDLTETVHMLDRDGQFLSYLLTESQEMDLPSSLSYDVNTHRLWVGSLYNNNVCVYRYITQNDALTDKNKAHAANEDGAFASSIPDVHRDRDDIDKLLAKVLPQLEKDGTEYIS